MTGRNGPIKLPGPSSTGRRAAASISRRRRPGRPAVRSAAPAARTDQPAGPARCRSEVGVRGGDEARLVVRSCHAGASPALPPRKDARLVLSWRVCVVQPAELRRREQRRLEAEQMVEAAAVVRERGPGGFAGLDRESADAVGALARDPRRGLARAPDLTAGVGARGPRRAAPGARPDPRAGTRSSPARCPPATRARAATRPTIRCSPSAARPLLVGRSPAP